MEGDRKQTRSLLAFMASALGLTLILALVLSGGVGASSSARYDVSNLRLDEPVTLSARAAETGGQVDAVVRLEGAPLAVAMGPNWKQTGGTMTPAEQRAYVAGLEAEQAALLPKIEALGAARLGSVTIALNAILVSVDSAKLDELQELPNVAAVREIEDYRLALTETVPHIGAAAVQGTGVDGDGVSVGVIDSGIDYTHKAFGGAGTAAAYTAAYGTTTASAENKARDGQFPNAKVTEGWDFVGEAWNGTATTPPLAPDPDPIDCGPQAIPAPCAGGHGSHVSDIIAGEARMDATNGPGVAPDATLVLLKACSAVSTACSGVALLQAMNRAFDPNNDGNVADAVDAINMSLGLGYGQIQDDLSNASTNAVNSGIVVVASAGNSSDRPYITGSPSSTPQVISVAQSHVPSASLFNIDTPSVDVGGVHQPWSATPVADSGQLVYDTTNASTALGCNANGSNPWVGTPHAGRVLLVDRGVCNVSLKSANGFAAGADIVIIANNVSGGSGPYEQPPTFSFGGGAQPRAAYTITLGEGNALKASALGSVATINPADNASLENHIVQSSSRGPNYSFNAIKPDLAAPGASLSAEAGTAGGNTAFGGTSGSAPMVTGSVALLLDKYNLGRTPTEIKSLLMNTAETGIFLNPVSTPGLLAPITRIGGGEVRVNNAAASNTAAWDDDADAGSLSFGFHTASQPITLTKVVRVRNFDSRAYPYDISHSFRYANDAASGAVTLSHPKKVTVPPRQDRTFQVKLTIDPSKLPAWNLDGGPNGGEGHLLQSVESDGYLSIKGRADNVHLAWHVLPRRSADVAAVQESVASGSQIQLANTSEIEDGVTEVFSLLGQSPQLTGPPPGPGSEQALIDLKEIGARMLDLNGADAGGEVLQMGISTYGARSHPNYPARFDVFVDTNGDAVNDYRIFNQELGAAFSSGQNFTFVQDLSPPCPAGNPAGPVCPGIGFFFTDADLDSGNVILTVPYGTPFFVATPGTQLRFRVSSVDNYFGSGVRDSHPAVATPPNPPMVFTPNTPRYSVPTDAFGSVTVPADDDLNLTVSAVAGGDTASPSQTGFLFLERLGLQPEESDTVSVTP